MAMRTEWAGTLTIGMVAVPFQAVKATDKYAGNDPIKELCECHKLPLDGTKRCRETQQAPAAKVKGVERPDESYAVLDAAQLGLIEQKLESPTLEVLSIEPRASIPLHTATDLFWLRDPVGKGAQPNKEGSAAIYHWLATHDRAIKARIVRKGRQLIVAVHADPATKLLCLSPLRYAQELREPDAGLHDMANTEVSEATIKQMDMLIGMLAAPEHFDVASATDESVTRKQQAITAALTGEPGEPVAATPVAPTTTAPDLMSQMKNSIEALEREGAAKPARKKPTAAKGKVKA